MSDEYLGFTYRGKRLGMDGSFHYEGFIMNDGEDLHFVSSPAVDNEFTQIPFGEQTFYLGNTKSNRSFSLTIVLKEFTLHQYREFLGWLNFDDKGTLIFDYNSNYGYNVKVEEIGEGQFDVVSCEGVDKYNITLDVSFITTERWTAKWIGTEVEYPGKSLIDNDEDEPFITGTSPNYTISNKHNVKNSIIIKFAGSFEIEFDGEKYNFTSISGSLTYFGEYGIVIDESGNFIFPNSKKAIPTFTIKP